MNRRHFIRSAAAGSAIAAGTLQSIAFGGERPSLESAPAFGESFELEELTIGAIQEGMTSGRFTSRSVTELYLKRIEKLDRTGPCLGALIELNPDALKIAEALDAERKSRGPRGPLHGIPILIKDNVGTADRMSTSGGSLALEGSVPSRDSFVAKRLREAGAVLLGKTNMSEWANFRSTMSTSGWSGRGGQCRNPYVLDRTPSGSSSGSGAAASANFCAAAVGTETDGSITAPSSVCGLVGIKPTVGLVSRAGIIPIAHSQDTAGPMCRTVTDAAILLGALAGVDVLDSATAAAGKYGRSDYTRFLDPDGMKKMRIGAARRLFGFHPRVDALMEESLERMRKLGAEVIEVTDFFDPATVGDSETDLLLFEFKADLNAHLASLPGVFGKLTLKELIDFNEKNADRELRIFGQELFLKAQEKGTLNDKGYLRALEKNHRLTRTKGIDASMDKYRLDAIVAPTTTPATMIDQVNGDAITRDRTTTPAAVAGYPHITLPAGFVGELPVGISFFGRAWSEPVLIKLAYAFEQATKARRPPKFLPSVKIS